jgi:chemotaxis protein MotB
VLLARRRRHSLDIWPGFVDALAALLMVVIFVLLLFSMGQFLLSDALIGRDAALDRLHKQMDGLSSLLTEAREDKASLQQRLNEVVEQRDKGRAARDELELRLAALAIKASDAETALAALQQELALNKTRLADQEQLVQQRAGAIQDLEAERDRLQTELTDSRQETEQVRRDSSELNLRLEALNEQIARLNNALQVSETQLKDKTLEVKDLGVRLNTALAGKVEELAAYRSEFFGKLREALKDNPDVRVEGDRFLLPSEVLFPSASAELDERGRSEIGKVASTLKTIAAKIPQDVDWVLRVDGHTDRRPIRLAFASNWELSSARATSIVKYLIAQGIPPDHLVAAGFAQYHPVDPGNSPEAYRRNRRIELKLTSR